MYLTLICTWKKKYREIPCFNALQKSLFESKGVTQETSENGKNLSAASQDMDVWAVPLHIKQRSRKSPHQLVVLVA